MHLVTIFIKLILNKIAFLPFNNKILQTILRRYGISRRIGNKSKRQIQKKRNSMYEIKIILFFELRQFILKKIYHKNAKNRNQELKNIRRNLSLLKNKQFFQQCFELL